MGNRDPESMRLYKMEGTYMNGNLTGKLSLSECQAVADKVCRRWRVPPVKIQFGHMKRGYGEYFGWPGKDKIVLYDNTSRNTPGHGRNMATLLHELAHHIDDYKVDGDPHASPHGPSFAAVSMELYDHYKILPAAAFKLLAKKHRVKIAPGIHAKMHKRKRARRGKWK